MSGDTAFERLDEVVHQRTRLGVLTILAEVKSASFTYLRDELDLSDGNLSRHLRVLEDAGLVSITKSFKGRTPLTTVKATKAGRKALADHLSALQEMINRVQGESA